MAGLTAFVAYTTVVTVVHAGGTFPSADVIAVGYRFIPFGTLSAGFPTVRSGTIGKGLACRTRAALA